MQAIEPIAIIGNGCRLLGGARSPDDLWKLLADGVEAMVEIPKDRTYRRCITTIQPSRDA
jgi:acyl transferase domain-containing protein